MKDHSTFSNPTLAKLRNGSAIPEQSLNFILEAAPKATPKHIKVKEEKLFDSLSLKKTTAQSIFSDSRTTVLPPQQLGCNKT